MTEPNVRYAHDVLRARLESLLHAGRIELNDCDTISEAFNIGVEYAANTVAAAWLRERRSIPITIPE